MSYALRIGYEPVVGNPARQFLDNAADMLDLDALVDGFASAIAVERAGAHMCCAVEEDGGLYPLFGDMPELADRMGAAGVEAIEVEAPDGTPMVVLIAVAASIDRRQLSQLRLAANIYVTHGVTLLEAADDEPAEGLSLTERRCLSLTLSGWSHLDIGEQLERSAPAVGVHIRRAMARLGAASVAEAVSIAAARGMISHQFVLGA